MKYVFISDLHLSPDTAKSNMLFYNLLNKWSGNISALYILGDFFDYWLGDDENTAFTIEMKEQFNNFTKHTPIYFIVGNHDFTLGKRFCRATGVQIIPDCTVLEVLQHRILLSHGDVFCSLDISYQKMKTILRNKILLFILLKLPLSLRYKIKQKIESKSSGKANIRSPETYQVVDKTIIELCNKHNANIVIHGHTHNPGVYYLKDGIKNITRIELPDWVDHKSGGYVLFDEDKIAVINAEDLTYISLLEQ